MVVTDHLRHSLGNGVHGPAELISAEGRGTLFEVMAEYTPGELSIGGPLWTRQAVVELIRLLVGVDMIEQGVGLWLRRHGFIPAAPGPACL